MCSPRKSPLWTQDDASTGVSSAWHGRYSFTVVPASGALSSVTAPRLCRVKPYTVLRPSPVPRPGDLVVKKGSNAGSRTASGMPLPESLTAIST